MRLLVFGRSAARIAFVALGAVFVGCTAPREPPASPREPVPEAPDPVKGEALAWADPIQISPAEIARMEEHRRGVPGFADMNAENDDVVGPPAPVADCEERLGAAGIEFRKAGLPVKPAHGDVPACGAEQVVEYRLSASGIRYATPPILTCTMALALARFERVLQDEAENHFNMHVKRLTHAGTYSCRRMARYTLVSEHSYANAIDLRAITLQDGRSIDVLHGFGSPSDDPATPQARFLRNAARRAYDEEIFSVVLTPSFDALHRDHFHLDMARYRVKGIR